MRAAPSAPASWGSAGTRRERPNFSSSARRAPGVFATPPVRRDRRERDPISSRSISSVRAMTSRNRPVPAAHLSFIAKSATLPSGVKRMTLLSWPPMSSTVLALGNRWRAPRAWHVISVTAKSADAALSLPYPVETVNTTAEGDASAPARARENASSQAFFAEAPVATMDAPAISTLRVRSTRCGGEGDGVGGREDPDGRGDRPVVVPVAVAIGGDLHHEGEEKTRFLLPPQRPRRVLHHLFLDRGGRLVPVDHHRVLRAPPDAVCAPDARHRAEQSCWGEDLDGARRAVRDARPASGAARGVDEGRHRGVLGEFPRPRGAPHPHALDRPAEPGQLVALEMGHGHARAC